MHLFTTPAHNIHNKIYFRISVFIIFSIMQFVCVRVIGYLVTNLRQKPKLLFRLKVGEKKNKTGGKESKN